MIGNARRNDLIAQHVEVALVYKEMLGLDEAKDYLERESIPRDITERVLLTEKKRRPPLPPGSAGAPTLQPTCRRKNLVHDAIVEAALKIEQKLGAATAMALLEAEDVPRDVAERILAQRPRQLRQRQRPR
jgi:hypothetical protein